MFSGQGFFVFFLIKDRNNKPWCQCLHIMGIDIFYTLWGVSYDFIFEIPSPCFLSCYHDFFLAAFPTNERSGLWVIYHRGVDGAASFGW
jgi:hypothetical protein